MEPVLDRLEWMPISLAVEATASGPSDRQRRAKPVFEDTAKARAMLRVPYSVLLMFSTDHPGNFAVAEQLMRVCGSIPALIAATRVNVLNEDPD